MDFKSIPYRDSDVLEWYRRVKLADRFYNQEDCSLLTEFIQSGVTKIVIEGDPTRDPPCKLPQPVYRNEMYQIYAVSAEK